MLHAETSKLKPVQKPAEKPTKTTSSPLPGTKTSEVDLTDVSLPPKEAKVDEPKVLPKIEATEKATTSKSSRPGTGSRLSTKDLFVKFE